jgi:hypothetical protein
VNEDQAEAILNRRLAAVRHAGHHNNGLGPFKDCPHCAAACRKRERKAGSIDWLLNEPVERPMPELAAKPEPYRAR